MFTCVIFVYAGRSKKDTRENKEGKFPPPIMSFELTNIGFIVNTHKIVGISLSEPQTTWKFYLLVRLHIIHTYNSIHIGLEN